MSLLPYILAATEDDLSAIGDYFDEHGDTLSGRFYDCFWKTVQTLARSPNLGERCRFRNPKVKGMRVAWLTDFRTI